MKRFLLVLFLLGLVKFTYPYTHIKSKETVTLAKLEAIDFHKYIGKEVGILMKDKLLSQYKSYLFATEPPGVLDCLMLDYSHQHILEIRVKEYRHLKQFNINLGWSLFLFKKEKIGSIRIVVHSKVVKTIN